MNSRMAFNSKAMWVKNELKMNRLAHKIYIQMDLFPIFTLTLQLLLNIGNWIKSFGSEAFVIVHPREDRLWTWIEMLLYDVFCSFLQNRWNFFSIEYLCLGLTFFQLARHYKKVGFVWQSFFAQVFNRIWRNFCLGFFLLEIWQNEMTYEQRKNSYFFNFYSFFMFQLKQFM